MSKNSRQKIKIGRPRFAEERRQRTSFTLNPDDIVWLADKARCVGKSRSEILEGCIALARRNNIIHQDRLAVLLRRYPTVYWDVDTEAVSEEKHIHFVIERMLEKGVIGGIRDLLIYFSREEVIRVVIESRRISRKTALFWKNYFNIKDPIHCLGKALPNLLSER